MQIQNQVELRCSPKNTAVLGMYCLTYCRYCSGNMFDKPPHSICTDTFSFESHNPNLNAKHSEALENLERI